MFVPYEWFDKADKLENEELLPHKAVFTKLRNNNLLDTDFEDDQNLICSKKHWRNFKSK